MMLYSAVDKNHATYETSFRPSPLLLPNGGLKRPEELLRCRVAAPLFHREAEFVKVGKRRRHCTLLSSMIWTWVRICTEIIMK